MPHSAPEQVPAGLTYLPEFNVALFAALLNLPWEFLQVPFFSAMPVTQHWEGVLACTRAALGDAAIMLIAYSAVSASAGRHWLVRPTPSRLAAFVAVGLGITVVIERLAVTGMWVERWSYAERMVIVPILEVGLTPLLQWLLLPPLVIWFSRRQLGVTACCRAALDGRVRAADADGNGAQRSNGGGADRPRAPNSSTTKTLASSEHQTPPGG